MTILEAIKSGKPYKQPGDEEWISQHATTLTILVSDVLAIDWEVEEDNFEVSESEIRALITAVEIGTGSLSIPEYIQKLKNGEYKTP